jgi:hypothetical protein
LRWVVQRVSDRHNQVAAKIVCGFATRVLDLVVTSVIAKLPILEFAVAIENDFSPNLTAQKWLKTLACGTSNPIARKAPTTEDLPGKFPSPDLAQNLRPQSS